MEIQKHIMEIEMKRRKAEWMKKKKTSEVVHYKLIASGIFPQFVYINKNHTLIQLVERSIIRNMMS